MGNEQIGSPVITAIASVPWPERKLFPATTGDRCLAQLTYVLLLYNIQKSIHQLGTRTGHQYCSPWGRIISGLESPSIEGGGVGLLGSWESH